MTTVSVRFCVFSVTWAGLEMDTRVGWTRTSMATRTGLCLVWTTTNTVNRSVILSLQIHVTVSWKCGFVRLVLRKLFFGTSRRLHYFLSLSIRTTVSSPQTPARRTQTMTGSETSVTMMQTETASRTWRLEIDCVVAVLTSVPGVTRSCDMSSYLSGQLPVGPQQRPAKLRQRLVRGLVR